VNSEGWVGVGGRHYIMLSVMPATSVEHTEPQCLLTLARSLKTPPPPHRISSFCVCARVLFVY